MKVFLVTTGSYSDYSVTGVFSTKANAEEFMAFFREDSYPAFNDIEEYELDASLPHLRSGHSMWLVHMERDGTAVKVEQRDEPSPYTVTTAGMSVWWRSKAPAYRGQNVSDLLVGNVFAESPKHAVKIANEQRTRIIANNEWPTA